MRMFETLHMGYISHMHHKLCAACFLQRQLSRGKPFMLDYLRDHAGCIQRDLARHWHLDPATVTSVLTSMEEDGLIERRAVPGDKRALQVFLTKKGSAAAQNVEEIHEQYEQLTFQGFTPEEKAQFKAFLDRMEANLSKAERCEKSDG